MAALDPPRISELDDPRDRIVQVCRWYMSAYHAGRKSAVAKKPYNPILGEVFQCHWDLPGELWLCLEESDFFIIYAIPGETQDAQEVRDGPVPWCRRDQLTFLAEQVSHHPPSKEILSESRASDSSFVPFQFLPSTRNTTIRRSRLPPTSGPNPSSWASRLACTTLARASSPWWIAARNT